MLLAEKNWDTESIDVSIKMILTFKILRWHPWWRNVFFVSFWWRRWIRRDIRIVGLRRILELLTPFGRWKKRREYYFAVYLHSINSSKEKLSHINTNISWWLSKVRTFSFLNSISRRMGLKPTVLYLDACICFKKESKCCPWYFKKSNSSFLLFSSEAFLSASLFSIISSSLRSSWTSNSSSDLSANKRQN